MSLNGIIGMALMMQAQIDINNKEWKERILNQWEDSKKYPRKKKKRIRKGLLLDWRFANWEPNF